MPFAGGDGSETNPYQIETLAQLRDAANNLYQHFVLNNDIDASATKDAGTNNFEAIGNTGAPFTGSFDGQGYTITGLKVRQTTDKLGLFGLIGSAGEVKNVSLVDPIVLRSGASDEGYQAGAIAGESLGTITNCDVEINDADAIEGRQTSGGIVGRSEGVVQECRAVVNTAQAIYNGLTDTNVGGLIGLNDGEIYQCASEGTGSVLGAANVGGLVGENSGFDIVDGGIILNSYSRLDVETNAADNAGGLIGEEVSTDEPRVDFTFVANTVGTDATNTGAFLGQADVGSDINHSFWDTDVANLSTGVGDIAGNTFNELQGKTTAEMNDLATFDSVWNISESLTTNDEWIIHPEQNDNYPEIQSLIDDFQLETSVVESGTINVTPDQSFFAPSTNVDVVADPATDHEFVTWSGDLSTTNTNETITMDGNKSITAEFTEAFTLTINKTGSGTGTVTKSPDETTYQSGEVVEVTANPDTDNEFVTWSGDLTTTNSTETITMDSDKTITAEFVQTYTLTLSTTGGGSGTVSKSPDKSTYDEGEVVDITADADPENEFVTWSGDLSTTNASETITMDSDKTITGEFVKTYSLTLDTDGGGSGTVTKTPDEDRYRNGQVVEISADPDSDSVFEEWTGTYWSLDATNDVTMDEDETITAVFGHKPLVQTITHDPSSDITTDEFVTFTAQTDDPDGNIETFKWKIDGSDVPPNDNVMETKFAQPGDHTVALTVVDNDGYETTDSVTVTVTELDMNLTAEFVREAGSDRVGQARERFSSKSTRTIRRQAKTSSHLFNDNAGFLAEQANLDGSPIKTTAAKIARVDFEKSFNDLDDAEKAVVIEEAIEMYDDKLFDIYEDPKSTKDATDLGIILPQ
jgi:hypothetical protein